MVKKRGLSRGLDALIKKPKPSDSEERIEEEKNEDGILKELPIEFLQSGAYQPRKVFTDDSMEELAASIRAQGVIQPIVVRYIAINQYEIIAGERRWRAAQIAELHEVPCIIKNIPDESAIAMSLIENIQREDLNPIEEAQALKRLMEEFQLTQQQAAEAVGKSRTAVTNLLRLLGLSEEVKTMLERGDLEMGHARALLPLDVKEQKKAAKVIAAKEYTVRETERLVKKLLNPPAESSSKNAPVSDFNITRLEESMSEKLGAPVKINHNKSGKGKLVVEYTDLDILEGILEHLGLDSSE
ncbi:MAG: ParB/RepB/Spo0J family partition protein [Pseudomonadota bacterium]